MTDHITIPIDVAEAAAEALGNFVSDHGWTDSDMQAMDNLDSYIARHKAIRAELAKPVEPSYTATQLAAMVLSDCGISTNCTMLHDRVARRIAKHEDELIENLQKLAKRATPAWHDAPTEPGLWMCDEGQDNPYRWTTHPVTFPLSPLLVGEDERWFGPIQPDGEKS